MILQTNYAQERNTLALKMWDTGIFAIPRIGNDGEGFASTEASGPFIATPAPYQLNFDLLLAHPNLPPRFAALVLIKEQLDDIGCTYQGCCPQFPSLVPTNISRLRERPLVTPRMQNTWDKTIRGSFVAGKVAVITQNTYGISNHEEIIQTVRLLRFAGLVVTDLLVLVDMEEDRENYLTCNGIKLHAIWTLTELARFYHRNDLLTTEELDAITTYNQNQFVRL